MEASLSKELGLSVDLIKGDDGIFDVVADGELIFSKAASGRFPKEMEIVDTLRARM